MSVETTTPSEEVKPIPAELSEEGKKYVENKAKEYRMQGMSDDEADKLAKEDWGKDEAKIKEANDAVWNEVVKKVHLADFLDDQMRRALGQFRLDWQKANPNQTIDFKLEKGTIGGVGGKGIIAGAKLELKYAINGVWKVMSHKVIKFKHVKEMREKALWSLELYEALFRDVWARGLTYTMRIDQWKEHEQQQRESASNATGDTTDTSK